MRSRRKKTNFMLCIMLALFCCISLPTRAMGVSSGDFNVSSGDLSVRSDRANSNSEKDIINVVVPTSFLVLMYEEYGEIGMQIQSQDILIINKSDFPIDVTVKDIVYKVKGNEESGLYILIKEFQKEQYTVPCIPNNLECFTIRLAEHMSDTNEEQLLNEAEGWLPIGPVGNADYSILRMESVINDAQLSENDVEIGIVYEFEKIKDDEN